MYVGQTLMDVYKRMFRQYGKQHWWPAGTRFEVMVGAVLTQSAAWSNVEKAMASLNAAGALSPKVLRRLPLEQLAQLVYSSGYYNQKSRKLKALTDYLYRSFQDDIEIMAQDETESLRENLLSVYGIGEETADTILLYALGKPIFVIDAYTRRIFCRLGVGPKVRRYSTYQHFFEHNLPSDHKLFGEYHALIVRHAVEVCRKKPLCQKCCLLEICPTGRQKG